MSEKYFIAQPNFSINNLNTIESYDDFLRNGCNGIHCKVHFTRDNVPVVVQNALISLDNYDSFYIKDLTYGQLNSYNLINSKIIPLSLFLKNFYKWRCFVTIELCNYQLECPDIGEKTFREIKGSGMLNRIIIASYNHSILDEMKLLNKNIKISPIFPQPIFPSVYYISEMNCFSIHVHKNSLNNKLIAQYNENKIRVFSYPYFNQSEIITSQKFNIDGIIIMEPQLAQNTM